MVGALRLIVGRNSRTDERGATATEYAILVGFMVFAMIVGLTFFGTALNDKFASMSSVVAGLN